MEIRFGAWLGRVGGPERGEIGRGDAFQFAHPWVGTLEDCLGVQVFCEARAGRRRVRRSPSDQ